MKKPAAPRTRLPLLAAAIAVAASACSVLETNKIDYKSARQGNSLEVPPDLSQLPGQARYTLPGGAVTASGYQSSQAASAGAQTAAATAANQIADVQFIRRDGERWLHVKRTPDQLWNPVRDFWLESGFLIAIDQPRMGLMETDWAENRAKLPQDFIRNTIGKLFDSLYSTGERDKFRIRIERTEDDGADIFITHRGMEEVYSTNQRDNTIWQPRARDPELETEFLRRLMVRLGATQEQAQAQTAAAQPPAQSAAAPAAARIVNAGGHPAVQLDDDFDRAWRRVGLALDRTGFTVEDRDRSQGVYFVRYVDPTAEKQEPGFFSRIFGGASKPLPTQQFRILVRSEGAQSTVAVLDGQGAPAPAAQAQAIVQVLAGELK